MRSKPMILAALLLAAFLVNLDTTMVNVALPAMVRELHATTTQLQWVVDAYNLVFAALLLTFGSLSDRFGRKGMLLAGLTVVGAASLAGGFTTTPAQLIAARAVMGLGAAMTFPATLSLIANVFTERKERARAIGLWGAIAGVAIAMGPIVGGWLLEHYSWAAIFIAMAPVAAAAAILVALAQPLGGLEGGQRVGVTAASQLEHSAGTVHPQHCRGLGFRSEDAFGALDPGTGLPRPHLPGQHGSEYHVGKACNRLVGPAVPLGQFDRLPAALGSPRERLVHPSCRLVGQVCELKKRPPDPAGQRDAHLQMALWVLSGCPELGGAEADQRQRAQFLAQARLRRVRGLGHGLQPLRLLGHRLQVPALAGQHQPGDPQQQVRLGAPGIRHHSALRQAEAPLGRLQRSVRQLLRRGQRRQLGICRASPGREPGEQLMGGGGLPVQLQAVPVVGE